MIYWIVSIAAAAIASLGGILIWRYGKSREEVGEAKANKARAEVDTIETVKAAENLKRIQHETQRIPDDDLDNELSAIGILRDDKDH